MTADKSAAHAEEPEADGTISDESTPESNLELAADTSPIEIEIAYPGEFLLFCVPKADARKTHRSLSKSMREWLYDCDMDEDIKALVAYSKLSVNILPNAQLEEFYHFVENGNLSREVQDRCFQAEMIVQLLAEGNEQLSYFAPFWTAFAGAWLYAGDLDAILIDGYRSPAFRADQPVWHYQSAGVPLSHQFLAVTGFLDEQSQKLAMHTTGMSRFGLPELQVQGVRPENGPEIAYLLRGVGQFMWAAIEKIIPASTTLQFSDEIDLNTAFCEMDKTSALNLQGTLLPVSLCWGESSSGHSRLIVSPTMEFETEDEWLDTIIEPLRQQRLHLAQSRT